MLTLLIVLIVQVFCLFNCVHLILKKAGFLERRVIYTSFCVYDMFWELCSTSLACGLTMVTYVLAYVGELLIPFASTIGADGFSPIRHILSVQIAFSPNIVYSII